MQIWIFYLDISKTQYWQIKVPWCSEKQGPQSYLTLCRHIIIQYWLKGMSIPIRKQSPNIYIYHLSWRKGSRWFHGDVPRILPSFNIHVSTCFVRQFNIGCVIGESMTCWQHVWLAAEAARSTAAAPEHPEYNEKDNEDGHDNNCNSPTCRHRCWSTCLSGNKRWWQVSKSFGHTTLQHPNS